MNQDQLDEFILKTGESVASVVSRSPAWVRELIVISGIVKFLLFLTNWAIRKM